MISALLFGCKQAPKRPEGVPASAVWSGGADGGAFFDCAPSRSGEPNPCTVYNDGTGDIYMSGRFVIQGQKRGATADELEYGGADGNRIYLKRSLTLAPLPPQRPASVPKTAMLAENGVYADCNVNGSNVYQCSLFLAANGEKFFNGRYRCDESLSVPCADLAPKIADRSDINLRNAGALKLIR